ncbi:MAG: histidine phosphotransferase family protein [Alphaproteobacteria bacterium]
MLDSDQTKILELLASKICHDLISPVGAVSNGIEILEELGPDAGEEVTGLIAFSASQANAKLKTMRMAYGLGGSDNSIKAEDVHKIFGEYIEGEKRLSQDWDPYAGFNAAHKSGFAKILLCGLMLVTEALPKGGILRVRPDGNEVTLIEGEGEGARFRDFFIDALHNKIDMDDMDPKFVHPYVTGLMLQRYGFHLDVDDTKNDIISLRLSLSNVS